MSTIDIADSIEQLLNNPDEARAAFDSALDGLSEKIRSQRIVTGPSLPDVSADLDPDQRRLVDSNSNTIRLLAPAGAGKTHCIVNKVVALLHNGADPKRILLVTFDRNSANELRGRLQELLGPGNAPPVSTLNALGFGLLRSHKWSGTPPQLLTSESKGYQQRLLKQLLEEVRTKNTQIPSVMPEGVKRTFFLDIFSYLKNQLYSPRDPSGAEAIKRLSEKLKPIATTSAAPLFAKTGDDKQLLLVLLAALDWLFRRYEQEKERSGYIDFDDQKLLAFEMLRDNEGVRGVVQRLNQHVIVDEFQDLNELDFRLIMLVAQKASLIVVGDDDQAIYGFRGTSPGYIIELPKLAVREVATYTLDRNYRCPVNIVQHATKLIRHNTYRIDKHPVAVREDRSDIRVYNALTPSAEAASIGEFIQRIVNTQNGKAKLNEIAILYRMNAQSLPVQLELLTRGIPYYCRKEDNILGQDYLPRVISILRVASAFGNNREPSVHDFSEAVRGYFQHLRSDELGRVQDLLHRSRRVSIDILDHSSLGLTKIAKSNVAPTLRELALKQEPVDALVFIAKRFRGIRGMVGSLEDAVNNELPLGELGDVALRFSTIEEFTDFLDEAIRRSRAVWKQEYDSNSVRLLTYFRSKGLQFDTVVLPSVNYGVIPHARAPVEDERRLFYVAVTRTRMNLWLSYVKRICNKAVDVSPFLKELDLPAGSWM
jgi:DNA helicase-2/ATP-dependent DNA helicase PcrA